MKLTKNQLKALHDDMVLASQIGDVEFMKRICERLKNHINALDDDDSSNPSGNPPPPPGPTHG